MPSRSARPFHVLVIEDEPAIRELITSILAQESVSVLAASTGLEGLKLARGQRFDLILLDVVLPHLDGISVCRMLKNEPGTASTPLYMLTAKAKKTDMDDAIRAGADGYIQKPFRAAELVGVIDKLRGPPA